TRRPAYIGGNDRRNRDPLVEILRSEQPFFALPVAKRRKLDGKLPIGFRVQYEIAKVPKKPPPPQSLRNGCEPPLRERLTAVVVRTTLTFNHFGPPRCPATRSSLLGV